MIRPSTFTRVIAREIHRLAVELWLKDDEAGFALCLEIVNERDNRAIELRQKEEREDEERRRMAMALTKLLERARTSTSFPLIRGEA